MAFMEPDKNKKRMLAAILWTCLFCAAIWAYYDIVAPPSMPDMAALRAIPAVPPSPPAESPEALPSVGGIKKAPSTSGGKPAPGAEFNFLLGAGLFEAIPLDVVTPDVFAFQTLPFDSPLAEFPLELGDEHMPEGPVIRDMELEAHLTPTEEAILDQMRSDIVRVPPAPPAPPPVTPPPEVAPEIPGPPGPPPTPPKPPPPRPPPGPPPKPPPKPPPGPGPGPGPGPPPEESASKL
jgi:hypothetical protein